MEKTLELQDEKEEFCRFCRLLYQRRLVSGMGGNLAVRAHNTILLTPSGISLRDMEPHMVVRVSRDGDVMEGAGPSKEAEMHLALLQTLPEIHATCHVHGAHIIAASTLLTPGENVFPALTPGLVHYAGPLTLLPFALPGSSMLARAVVEELSRRRSSAVLLQNHGAVTVGKSLRHAFDIAEEIDEAARVYVLTGGKAGAISSEDSAKIR